MRHAKQAVLLEWLAMPEELQRTSRDTAERLMREGSVVVNRDGVAYVLREGRLYFTRLKMEGYSWLLHGPLHDGENLLPPGDDWMDIDPPEGLDDLLPVEVSPSIVRGPAEDPEPEAVSAPVTAPEEPPEKPVRKRGRPKGSRSTSKTPKARETATVPSYAPVLDRIADSLEDLVTLMAYTAYPREGSLELPPRVREVFDKVRER